jgi:predicted permease
MAGTYTDLNHAFRLLIRRPGHTFAIVMCLSVGLTVTIGTFSVLTSFLYGDQPGISNRRELVRLYLNYDQDGQRETTDSFSLDDFAIIRDVDPALGSFAAEGSLVVAVSSKDGPIAVESAFVSGDYFKVLGTSAHAGRMLTPEDDSPKAPSVAVVSEHFWRTRLEGKSDAIGQPILLADRSFTIVGVTPPGFHGLRAREADPGDDDSFGLQVWIPLQHASSWPGAPSRRVAWLGHVVGRIRSGHTVDQARASLTVSAAQLAAAHPSIRANASFLLGTHGFNPNNTRFEILMMIGAVLSLPLTVFAISCGNVTNLQLARAAERARELAVRLSFGASRGQLIRLLTLETLFPAAVAVGTSLVITLVVLRFSDSFLKIQSSIDWTVAAFSFGLMMTVTFFTGLVPAWLVLRRPAALGLKQTAQAGGLSLSRLRSILVIGQVALSLVMLCGAGLILRSVNSMNVEVPAVLRSQIVADFNPAQIGASEPEASRLPVELLARVSADPRVLAASLSRTGSLWYRLPDSGDRRYTQLTEVTPSWLQVMDLPILTGRSLTNVDGRTVGLVSAALADSIAPGESPLGRILQIDDGSGTQWPIEIVGVVADNRTRPMSDADRPAPTVYITLPPSFSHPFTLRIRTQSPDSVTAVSADLRNIVRAVDPRFPWLELSRGEEMFLRDAPFLRYFALSIAGLGVLALTLAATGLYAVMSYVVMLRRREIGIRMAIGADPQRILKMIVSQGLRLVLTGGGIGLALAIPLAFALRAVLFSRLSPLDPVAVLPPFGLLLIVGLLASVVPAFRASTTDPINTLREE